MQISDLQTSQKLRIYSLKDPLELYPSHLQRIHWTCWRWLKVYSETTPPSATKSWWRCSTSWRTSSASAWSHHTWVKVSSTSSPTYWSLTATCCLLQTREDGKLKLKIQMKEPLCVTSVHTASSSPASLTSPRQWERGWWATRAAPPWLLQPSPSQWWTLIPKSLTVWHSECRPTAPAKSPRWAAQQQPTRVSNPCIVCLVKQLSNNTFNNIKFFLFLSRKIAVNYENSTPSVSQPHIYNLHLRNILDVLYIVSDRFPVVNTWI